MKGMSKQFNIEDYGYRRVLFEPQKEDGEKEC